MRKLVAIGFVSLAFTTAIARPAPTTAEQVVQLVSRLGSPAFREREAAFRELDQLGEPALGELKAAVASSDSERARRASELVRRIEQRVANARILQPTLVEFSTKNTPITQAVLDFASATKLPIAIAGDTSKMLKRQVTYETSGRVPVWEALAGFLRAAELTEWDGLTPIPGLPSPMLLGQSEAVGQQMFVRGQVIIRNPSRGGGNQQAPRQLFLYDGTASLPPVYQNGAVRVRALPPTTPLPAVPLDSDEFAVPLQISLEPKINWNGSPLTKIGAAVDDAGQAMTATVVRPPEQVYFDEEAFDSVATTANQRSKLVVLRFRRGERPAAALREVAGTLTMPVRVVGLVAVVEQPLKMAGSAVEGKGGTSLKLESIKKGDNGAVTLDVVVETPVEGFAAFIAMNQVAVGQLRNGRFRSEARTEVNGFTLSDERGRPYTLEVRNEQQQFNGTEREVKRMTLIAKPPKDGGEAARLTYSASYPTVVETPFRFTDLPMPR